MLSGSRPARVMQWAIAAAASALVAACGTASSTGPSSETATWTASPAASTASPSDAVEVQDYLPGLAAQVRFPSGEGAAPLIVMVPGGGWSTADPAGLIPLAERLTTDGWTTSLITYSTTSTGSTFPQAVDDVACAVRWSAAHATAAGHPPTEVIVLGHSAGGHLAALVAFSGQEFGGDCPDPAVAVDGLIGLAGVYDTDQIRPALSTWMGVDPGQDEQTWRRANPMAWLGSGASLPDDLRVLLLHGDADTSVPLAQTTALAEALRAEEVPTDVVVLPRLGHLDVFRAESAGPPIEEWMRTSAADALPSSGSG